MPSSTRTAGDRRSLGASLIDNLGALALALVLFLALRSFLFQPFTVPSDSMEPALRAGDYMVVSKFDYGFSRFSAPLALPGPAGRWPARRPRRGDVVVFKLPRDTAVDYVKRLIGLPGDRIRLIHGQVWVNGRPLAQTPLGLVRDPDNPGRIVMQARETNPEGRSYLILREDADHEGEDTGVYVVPPAHYFFMGDNRDNSADSRWPQETGVGYVPAENLEGRVRMVLLSWRPGATILKPWTWLVLNPERFLLPVR
jgi:signal peptidase I